MPIIQNREHQQQMYLYYKIDAAIKKKPRQNRGSISMKTIYPV
jgi:hypothetical protein